MKNNKIKKTILIMLLTIGLIIGILSPISMTEVKAAVVYREDGYIELYADDLASIKEEELSKVVQITIRNSVPAEAQSLIEKCINLESLYVITADDIKLNFLNNVDSQRKITLYIQSSNVDFTGIDNDAISSINIANSTISNIKQLENISSLEQFGMSEVSGYEELDYTKFPNLTSLVLATYIEDFDKLTASIPNVTNLSLAGSNIQNKDAVYLERLTNLKSLNLNQTFITDIDFLNKLTNLESLTLPWSVTDLSPIYNLKKLNYLVWEAYTELFVTQELVDYLEENNVWHYDYNPNVKNKIDSIIEELNITKETKTEEALSKLTKYIVEQTTDVDTSGYSSNISSLDSIILNNKGVCYHHSIALYTIAKVAGINDVYAVSGILLTNINPYGGEDEINVWSYMAHAWNLVEEDGIWYGVDAAQMNQGLGYVDESLYDMNFWKNPFNDDEYDYDYAMENYLDFNYFYVKRHLETDGILNQTRTYQFKDITGLDIKNHVIYEYDTTDKNAQELCDRVLDNYTCTYEDTDSSNSITTGDTVLIKKGDITIETFTLSTEKWVKPVKKYLGKVELEYTKYPEQEIDYKVSTLYYNEDKSLTLKIKGENYDENTSYPTTITVKNLELDEEAYTKDFTFTGKEINEGIEIVIPGGLLITKEPPAEDQLFGSIQYIVSLNVDGELREKGFDYIDEGILVEEEKEEVKDEETNPETLDKIIFIGISAVIFGVSFIYNNRKRSFLK